MYSCNFDLYFTELSTPNGTNEKNNENSIKHNLGNIDDDEKIVRKTTMCDDANESQNECDQKCNSLDLMDTSRNPVEEGRVVTKYFSLAYLCKT